MYDMKSATLQADKRNDEGHGQTQIRMNQLELPKTAEELQMLLQMEGDRRVTLALKTAGIKWQKRMLKMLADERNEAERMTKLAVEKREKEVLESNARELEEKERALKYRELELKVIGFLLERKLPVELKEFVLSRDEETSLQKVEELGRLWNIGCGRY